MTENKESNLAKSWRETQERDANELKLRQEEARRKQERDLVRAQNPSLIGKLYSVGRSGLRRIPGFNR